MKRSIVMCFTVSLLVLIASASYAQSKTISIPACAFHPGQEVEGAYYTQEGDDVHVSGPFDEYVHYHHLYAPVILPHGAKITSFKVYAAQGHNFGSTLYLKRSYVSSGSSVRKTVAKVNLTGDYNNNDIRIFSKIYLKKYPTIDNTGNTYYLDFYARSQEAGDDSYIHHVEISYIEGSGGTIKLGQ